jgi:hypothetical protein
LRDRAEGAHNAPEAVDDRIDEPSFALSLQTWIICVVGGLSVAALVFLLEGRVGYSTADEGYLWYGVRSLGLGQFPLRDFQAYAPGRYLLATGLVPLVGDGPLAPRIAAYSALAVVVAVGLFLGRTIVGRWRSVATMALPLLVAVWAVPWWKLFDHAMIASGTVVSVALAARGARRNYALHGAVLGAATFIGFNHALYIGVAGAVLLLYRLSTREHGLGPGLLAYGGGFLIGLLPMLALPVLVPGFGAGVARFVQTLAEAGRTNVARPVPWPWEVWPRIGPTFTGTAFLLVLGVYLVTALMLLRRTRDRFEKDRALAIGCLAIGLPYLHHAFSRADIYHLAQAAFPALVLSFFHAFRLLHARRDWSFLLAGPYVLILLAVTSWIATVHPFADYVRAPDNFVSVSVEGDQLLVAKGRQRAIRAARELRALVGDDRLLVMPAQPGLYAFLDTPTPVYDIYSGFLPSPAQELTFIDQLEKEDVQWALIDPRPVGGDPRLAFVRSHPRVSRYLAENFREVPTPGGGRATLYRRR